MRFPRLTASSVKTISVFSFVLALAACSDSSNNSNRQEPKIDAYVEAGNGDITNAQVSVTKILTAGFLEEATDGQLQSKIYATQANQSTYVAAQTGRMHLFELVSSLPNISEARCQWVDGCGAVEFGKKITGEKYQWRSAVWALENNQHISITPLTELAAELAKNRVYHAHDETSGTWIETGYYSPQGLVQSVSQVTQLFGFDSSVGDIQSIKPADLTSLNNLDVTNPLVKESVRYGALVAAWAHLNLDLTKVTDDLLSDGQLFEKDTNANAELSLDKLYTAAINNLTALELRHQNSEALPVLKEVKDNLIAQQRELTDGKRTAIKPAPLDELLDANDAEMHSKGLDEAKKMVEELNKVGLLFDADYKTQLDDFKGKLDGLNTANSARFDALIKQVLDVQEIYRVSFLAKGCSGLTSSFKECQSFNDGVLLLKTHQDEIVRVSLANTTSNAQAVDIRIEGVFQADTLQLKLAHKSSNDVVSDYSRVRVFFDKPASTVIEATALGYEIRWADFELQALTGNAEEFKLSGALTAFYLGVFNPLAPKEIDQIHYNVDSFSINGCMSNSLSESDCSNQQNGQEIPKKDVLNVAAKSLNSNNFYGADKYGSFSKLENFFDSSQTDPATLDGANVVTYEQGNELLSGDQDVQFVDVRIEGGKSSRYRFYPTRKRDIIDNYGNKIGFNNTYDMSVCPIVKENNAWKVEGTCSPKTRFEGERDVQKTMNDIWRTGSLSYVTVPNKGEFFVEWPATINGEGCFDLDALEKQQTPLDGKGLEVAELGIDTLTMESVLNLTGAEKVTSYALQLRKPTSKRYEITSALTYGKDKITIYYNTNSAFKRTGSFTITRDGVSIGESKISGDLGLGLEQGYKGQSSSELPHKYIIDDKGKQTLCVTSNEAYSLLEDSDKDDAVYSLTFRGTVYGTIRKDLNDNEWKATFIDGSPAVPMTNFNKFFEL